MSVEAFIWRYERGESVPLPLEDVLRIFRPYVDAWDAGTGVLRVRFGDVGDACDLHLGALAASSGATRGITILRPLREARLWDCVLEILRSGNAILFFSDDSTPLYATPGAPAHFPPDLLQMLGEPKLVAHAEDILRSHEG